MPDNPLPDAKTEKKAEAAEFNFAQAEDKAPRMRRRSLKSKQAGLVKAPAKVPAVALELKKEAPPHLGEEVKSVAGAQPVETKSIPATSVSTAATVKPSEEPAMVAAKPSSTVVSGGVTASPATGAPPKTVPSTSPHPTRPATLYYSSQPRKEKEAAPISASAPMKTIPPAGTNSTPSTQPNSATRSAPSGGAAGPTSTARPVSDPSATSVPVSMTRPAAASASRPSTTTDYRANIERQSREQKSVGSLLAYVVYGLIAFLVLSAALAGYGGYILSQRISDQSVTVSQLDTKYTGFNKELRENLALTQEKLTQAQSQISRDTELINKQQDKLNQLITAINDNTKSIAAEKQARAQETNLLRGRVRQLENDQPAPTTTTR